MTGVLGELVASVGQLPVEFAKVAAGGPAPALLLLVGALLVAFSAGVFAYLTLGAVLAPLGLQLWSPGGGQERDTQ